jgi:hypothetical protein
MRKDTIVLLAIFSLAACATGPPPLDWDYTVDAPNEALTITVVNVYQHYQVFQGYSGVEGIGVSIQNTTSQPIVINWNKSALEYNGTSHRLFITGQKYIDAGKDIPDRVIGAGSRIDVDIFPAESPYYESGTYGGWRMRGFTAETISCLVCAIIDGEERFYTARITIAGQS